MVSLVYLNFSHNLLSQTIGDLFHNLQNLSDLDLSFNSLSGDLPTSMELLSNISSLYLQNNQLTGSVNLLSNLDLINLDISNNHFTGWIPQDFHSIPNLIIEGNSFQNGLAPPPPPYTPPPPRQSHNHHLHSEAPAATPNGDDGPKSQAGNNSSNSSTKSLTTGAIISIVAGSMVFASCAILAALFFLCKSKKKGGEKQSKLKHPVASLPVGANKAGEWHQFSDYISSHAPTEWNFRTKEPLSSNGQSSSFQQSLVHKDVREYKLRSSPRMTQLKPLPSEKLKADKLSGQRGSARVPRVPVTAAYYSVASLQTATNSFSQEHLIGEGSLGRVYRGEFSNGKILAVKKLDGAALSLQDEDVFLEAVSNISHLRHPNVTALVGYCAEHDQHLLVYEYISNGALHDMLHFSDDSRTFSWNARVKVALGTARALEYLHEVYSPAVVHRNLKTANILLDEDLNAHLSDCGLSALTHNTERQLSKEMIPSFGYSAPEFAMSGVYTVKSDVYSFGVVMLELLTGRKPLDCARVRSEQSLVRWAIPQLHDIDALEKMVDPSLNGMYPAKSISRFADIIALCVQPEPEFRPPMSEVVQALVRLMQRTSMIKRSSADELGFSYRIPEHEATSDMFI
ncbi:Protein STRUBBELIG-RECEPTOR FAMILY 8 [Platanthera zijinensis]|uniref:Protein STRUBBELIG-RECEPTOR FAMILY 8 n=1 Tax=Platanthera zijinensis TaxID=2320716 RepID=A0AAP0BZD2_9ASPA